MRTVFIVENQVSRIRRFVIIAMSMHLKGEFERVFGQFSVSGDIQYVYLPSFHRVRITYSQPQPAVRAKLSLDGVRICNSQIRCFLTQVHPSTLPTHTHSRYS